MEYNQKKLTERLFCTPETHTILQIRYTPIIILKRMSVSQFSHSFMSNSLWPQGLQHSRLPCPSSTPGAYSNSCPWSQWCHPPISSSVVPFSSCLQSFPTSESFLMSQFFASGGQSIGVSSFSISPSNEYSGLISFRMDWFDGHEFEQDMGVSDRQGSLACCGSWGRKESDTTERLNWTEPSVYLHLSIFLGLCHL